MDEKIMVNDVLENIKSELVNYQNTIAETENMRLRQTFQQIRDSNESFQYELLKVAESKGYYKKVQKVTVMEIENVKNELQE